MLLLCSLFFPQIPKMRHFIAGLSWLVWLKSNTIFQTLFFKRTFNPERNAYKAAEHIGFDRHLIFLPTFLSGCTIKKSTIPHKFSIQNPFTVLLDVVSRGYILRVSKKPGIHAWWHSTSGGTFKTHNKYWESWDALTMIGNKIRNHIPWLSPGLHLSYDVLCCWQIIYGKVFGNECLALVF